MSGPTWLTKRTSTLVVLAGALVACDGHVRAAEPARVLVNEVGLSHAAFGSPQPRQKWIAELVADGQGGGVLVALGDGGARWLDSRGAEVGWREHPKNLRRLAAVRFRPDEELTTVGSTDAYGRRLTLLPGSGGPVEIRLAGSGATYANVSGDNELEIVAHHLDSLLVYDRRGQLLRTIGTGEHVDQIWPVDTADGRYSALLVYRYRTRKEGTSLTLLDADGQTLRAWHEPVSNRYSICRWPSPAPEIIASRDDVFTVRAATTGEVLKRYVVPGSGSYRRVETGALEGGYHVLLAVTGSCPSRLLVFDGVDRLVYHEVLGGYATLLVPGGQAPFFYLATGGAIRKYTRQRN